MGKIIIPPINVSTVANPAAGKYLLAFDLDGFLKIKKDDGTIIPIGGGEFLPLSGGELTTGAAITSEIGSAYLSLSDSSTANSIYLGSADAALNMRTNGTDLYGKGNLTFTTVTNFVGLGEGTTAGDMVIANVVSLAQQNNTGFTPSPLMLSAQGALIDTGVTNSAIIGSLNSSIGADSTRVNIIGGSTNQAQGANVTIIGSVGVNAVGLGGFTNVVAIGGSADYTIQNSDSVNLLGTTYLGLNVGLLSDRVDGVTGLRGRLDLDYSSSAGKVMLSCDNGAYNAGQFYIEQGYVEMSTYYTGDFGGGAILIDTNNKGLYMSDSSFSFQPFIMWSSDTSMQIVSGSSFGETKAILEVGGANNSYEVLPGAQSMALSMYASNGIQNASIKALADPPTGETSSMILLTANNGGFYAFSGSDGHLRVYGASGYVGFYNGIERYADHLLSIQPNTRTLHAVDETAVVKWDSAIAGLVYQADFAAGYTDRSIVDKGYVDTRVNTVKVSLTASQILTANSAPVEVIPAPGAGKIISVVSALCKFNFGTTAFDGVTLADLIHATATSASVSTGDIGGGVSTFGAMSPGYGGIQLVENQALLFKADGDSTVGDSTVDLYITYSVITL